MGGLKKRNKVKIPMEKVLPAHRVVTRSGKRFVDLEKAPYILQYELGVEEWITLTPKDLPEGEIRGKLSWVFHLIGRTAGFEALDVIRTLDPEKHWRAIAKYGGDMFAQGLKVGKRKRVVEVVRDPIPFLGKVG